MRNLSFMILSALLFVVVILLLLLFNELSECSDSYIVSAIVATIVSTVPPMFYRSSKMLKKIVMVIHIITVTVASHLLSQVWSEVFYGVCTTKADKDTVLLYGSVVVVAYAMITVFGHFMKRSEKETNYDSLQSVEREDL